MLEVTPAGAIHTALASAGILAGAVQFLRPKGGPIHRAFGYLYVYSMLVSDGAALVVYQFTGRFNALHVGAILNAMCIALAMWPALRSPRAANWKDRHYVWISWSYVGLLAAASTEAVVRNMAASNRWMLWGATVAVTIGVTLSGYLIIQRNRRVISAQFG